jgi:outer membrane protein assembly factor BamB
VTAGSGSGASGLPQPRDATVQYPGGLRARWRWAGSGQGAAVFALTEAGGTLEDLGPLVSSTFEELCRAELRVDGPAGAWTVRLASTISDEPAGLLWDEPALLVVKYGFHTYGLDSRTGALRWSHRSASPVLVVLASPRLRHVIVQSEIETFAIEADGTVGWRIAHSDVVTEAALIGGRLVLTSFAGQATAIDPATGRVAPG